MKNKTMTDESAIEIMKQFRDREGNSIDDIKAFDVAIQYIEQQINRLNIITLKLTEDEYYNIQRILSNQMKYHEYDVDNLSWYDFKYISNALEYARKEGESNANDQ